MSISKALRRTFFEPIRLERIAVLRIVLYLFVIGDMLWIVNDVIPHASGSPGLYHPLNLREMLSLPVPNPAYVHVERIVIAAACLSLVVSQLTTDRLPKLGPIGQATAGLVVAAGFTDWVSIGFSYSKIDHDHFALITAVWVLPTVGVGRAIKEQAKTGNTRTRRSEAAGWALVCIQLACIATYFLSALAKVRFGGWDWPTGSTFAWSMIRRGTELGHLLLDPPWLLKLGQFSVFAIELASPLLLLLRGRARYAFVAVFLGFHLSTYLTLTIHFLPLVICLLAFLPVENLSKVPARVRQYLDTRQEQTSETV